MLTAAGTWTTLGRGVQVRESRAYRMNSVLLLSTRHSVVVDPGVLPSEIEEIAAKVRETKPRKLTLLFTHGHWDHVLGRSWWPEASTVGHVRLASEIARDAAKIVREAETIASDAGESWPRPFEPFDVDLGVMGGQTARLGSWVLAFLDGAGHSDTQIAIHVEPRKLLLAADMLSDIEIPALNGPISVYQRTLEGLRPLIASGAVEHLVPGHGSPAKGVEAIQERIDRDLAYLEALDSKVRAARRSKLSLGQAQHALDAMEYTGKTAAYSMVETHHRNLRHAWDGIEAETRV